MDPRTARSHARYSQGPPGTRSATGIVTTAPTVTNVRSGTVTPAAKLVQSQQPASEPSAQARTEVAADERRETRGVGPLQAPGNAGSNRWLVDQRDPARRFAPTVASGLVLRRRAREVEVTRRRATLWQHENAEQEGHELPADAGGDPRNCDPPMQRRRQTDQRRGRGDGRSSTERCRIGYDTMLAAARPARPSRAR